MGGDSLNLIEDLKEAGELAASSEDYVRFDPRGSFYARIIAALEAASKVSLCDHIYTHRCMPGCPQKRFDAAIRGDTQDGVEVESTANVPPKKRYSGKGRLVSGDKKEEN